MLRQFLALTLLLLTTTAAANNMDDAYAAFERGDVDTAVKKWKQLAADGNATAQLNLGQVYRQGKGVPQDDREAITWYTLAARNGSETARYTLALMRQKNRATEADLVAAGMISAETGEILPEHLPQNKPAAVPAQAAPKAEAAAPASSPAPASAPTPTPEPNWLAAQAPDTWLIQLIAAANEDNVRTFARKHVNASTHPYQVVQSPGDARGLYRLVIGPYTSQQEANAAVAALSGQAAALKPWVRRTQSLQ